MCSTKGLTKGVLRTNWNTRVATHRGMNAKREFKIIQSRRRTQALARENKTKFRPTEYGEGCKQEIMCGVISQKRWEHMEYIVYEVG